MFKGLKLKFFIVFLIIALIILAAFYLIYVMASSSMVTDRAMNKILAAEKYYTALEEQDTRMIQATLNVFVEEPEYKEFFLANDRESLFDFANPLFQKLKGEFGITHFYFHSLDGVNFLRVHNKDIFGDQIERITFRDAKEKNDISNGVELGKTAFALRVVSPYYNKGELIGYVEMGQEINHFIQFIKEREEEELVVFVEKQKLSKEDWKSVKAVAKDRNNWEDLRTYLKIDSTYDEGELSKNFETTCFNEKNISEVINSKEAIFFEGILENDKFLTCSAFPIKDASGDVVGAVFSSADLTKTKNDIKIIAVNMIGAFAFLIILIFSIYLFFVNKFFINPVNTLKEMVVKVTKKDFSARVLNDSNDEIGELSKNFNKMAKELDKSNLEIEMKIKERTERLEELNRHMVGREEKMLELKEEIEKLKNKS